MKVSDFIVQELIRLGVTDVFTLVGGFSQHLNDSIAYSSLKPTYFLHESGAAFAACAYAQYTGRLGVLVVTSGPGSTNALTGVASAWNDSLPLLIISGEANLENIIQRQHLKLRKGGPQDVEIVEIAKPITKLASCMTTVETIEFDFLRAVKTALEPRCGPVWMAIPLDIQRMELV
jgi:acetolactate synthase I/II/III large subunit